MPECSESCKKNTCRITGSDLRHLDEPITLSREGQFEVNDCANEVLIFEQRLDLRGALLGHHELSTVALEKPGRRDRFDDGVGVRRGNAASASHRNRQRCGDRDELHGDIKERRRMAIGFLLYDTVDHIHRMNKKYPTGGAGFFFARR